MPRNSAPRPHLPAGQRIAEIIRAAARIGLDEGLERITLRHVAQSIGVRPGLISHYFPEAEGLVAAAFQHLVEEEHEAFFSAPSHLPPFEQVRAFFAAALRPEKAPYSRLWLNARNLSRYNQTLKQAVIDQEDINRARLNELFRAGTEDGSFHCDDPEQAAMLALVLIDALSGYANEDIADLDDRLTPIITNAVERELGIEAGSLRPTA